VVRWVAVWVRCDIEAQVWPREGVPQVCFVWEGGDKEAQACLCEVLSVVREAVEHCDTPICLRWEEEVLSVVIEVVVVVVVVVVQQIGCVWVESAVVREESAPWAWFVWVSC